MPVLLAHAIEDSTDMFGISGGGVQRPPSSVHHWCLGYCVHQKLIYFSVIELRASFLFLLSVMDEIFVENALVGVKLRA